MALGLHLYAAWFSAGFHHYDEQFQIIEPLIGNAGTWDFTDKIRPWFQISLYKGLISPLHWLGLKDPFIQLFWLRALSSLLGFFSLNQLWKWWLKRNPDTNPEWAYILIQFFWLIPYFHARTSAENLGTSFFLFCLTWFFEERPKPLQVIFAGLMGAFAFWARFHLGLPVFLIWIYSLFHKSHQPKNQFLFPTGVVLGVLIGFGLDSYHYGEWSFSPWNYIVANLVEGKASGYGTSPWYSYFKWALVKGVPPVSLLFFGGLGFYWMKKPKDLLTWIGLPFFIIHILVAHKEARFLFPLIPFAQLAVLSFFPTLPIRDHWWKKAFFYLVLLSNTGALLVSINKPANSRMTIQKVIHNQGLQNLASFGESPYYTGGLTMTFTNPQGTKIEVFSKERPLAQVILFNRWGQTGQFEWIQNCQKIYQSMPDFMIQLVPQRKQDRLRVWTLFDCSGKNP